MARKVKISSLGQYPPRYPDTKNPDIDSLIEGIINFWKGQIDIVLPDQPDLIILPENCDRYLGTPNDLVVPFRRAMGTKMLDAMRKVARDNNCYVVHSSSLEEKDGTWRNAAILIDREGEVLGQYNKNHTTVGEIDKGILCGVETPIFQCDFGTVGFAICFDLNFDELRLKYKALHPDLLIFSSNYHGGLMQSYWAYSCRCHFVGAIGLNNLPNEFYSPVGHKIASSTNYFQPITHTLNLDCVVAHIDFNRKGFTELKKKYGADVTIFDPGQLGSVLITSESDSVSVQEMITEFDIEPLDDYLQRSLEHQHNPANHE